MPDWSIEPLAPHHERSGFDCGNAQLNDWIEKHATQHVKKGLCRAYMMVRPAQPRVIGFYTLSSSRMDYEVIPASHAKKFAPRLEIPSVLLGRLAIDKCCQGQGVGSILLLNAFARILLVADEIGIFAVTVDAADESARSWYLHRDFEPLLDDPLHLYYPVNDIRKLELPPLVEPAPKLMPLAEPFSEPE